MTAGPATRSLFPLCAGVLLAVVAACGSDTADPAGTASSSGAVALPAQVFTPLVGSVMFPPTPFSGSDGQRHLVYEISLTNFTSGQVTVTGLRTVDPESKATLAALDEVAVAGRTKPTGAPAGGTAPGAPEGYSNVLAGGQNGIVFVHVVIPQDAATPEQLTHEVDVVAEVAPPGSDRMTETLAAVQVGDGDVPVLGAPLVGSNYLAADACCDALRHTHSVLPINGTAYLAQRYAVDWEQSDDQGRLFVGDPKDPASYRIFGDDVLAVADGTVVQSRNDLPEQTPGTYPQGIPLDEADGNNLVLDVGDGFYVNYAHMQPGSVRFEAGQTVKRGDVVGKVGNTGNSVAPHLHVHVMNGPSFLASQGVPSVTESFTVTGQVASTADFDRSEGTGVPLVVKPGVGTTDHTDQMVLDQTLVTFADNE